MSIQSSFSHLQWCQGSHWGFWARAQNSVCLSARSTDRSHCATFQLLNCAHNQLSALYNEPSTERTINWALLVCYLPGAHSALFMSARSMNRSWIVTILSPSFHCVWTHDQLSAQSSALFPINWAHDQRSAPIQLPSMRSFFTVFERTINWALPFCCLPCTHSSLFLSARSSIQSLSFQCVWMHDQLSGRSTERSHSVTFQALILYCFWSHDQILAHVSLLGWAIIWSIDQSPTLHFSLAS